MREGPLGCLGGGCVWGCVCLAGVPWVLPAVWAGGSLSCRSPTQGVRGPPHPGRVVHRPAIVGCAGEGGGHPQSPSCGAGGNPPRGKAGPGQGGWLSPRGAGTLAVSPVLPPRGVAGAPSGVLHVKGTWRGGCPQGCVFPAPGRASLCSPSLHGATRHPRPAWLGPGPRAVPMGHRARNAMPKGAGEQWAEASGVWGGHRRGEASP